MSTIALIFYLLTMPTDRLICSVWTNHAPTSGDIVAACGTLDLAAYELRVVNNATGLIACDHLDGGQIYTPREACQISGRLDGYRLDLIRPNYAELICSIETLAETPSPNEISDQCSPEILKSYQAGDLELRYMTKREIVTETHSEPLCAPPPLITGAAALEKPKNAAELASAEKYHLLAGKLIWFGYAKPTKCPGGLSGVDIESGAATACGMESAASELYAWQNRLDDQIFAAAAEYNVPPRLLKRLIATESQFWPWTGSDGEAGLIQITDQGADLVLRYTLEGYLMLNADQRQAERSQWLNALRCDYCDVNGSMQHAAKMMPQYAQALAAFYCQYGSWEAALNAWNIKHHRMTKD